MFDTYSIWGDISVIAICLIIVILLKTSYVSRTRKLAMFANTIISLFVATVVSIVYHVLLKNYNPGLFKLIYAFRIIYVALLYDVFCLFILYATEVSGMNHTQARIVVIVAVSVLVIIPTIDIIRTIFGQGFRVADDGTVLQHTNMFLIGYIFYVVMIAVLMFWVRNLVYKRVLFGFFGVMGISLVIRVLQIVADQSTLTTITFVYPIIAMLYIMHSNPYNVTLGAVDVNALQDMVRNLYEKNAQFIFLSLHLSDFDAEGKEIPKGIQDKIRKGAVDYFRKCFLFQIGNGHVILIVPTRRNQDYEVRITRILDFFQSQYAHYQSPYKIVIGESIDAASMKNEYVSLVKSVESSMAENSICRVGQEEIERFNYNEYVFQELEDIFKKKDLEDPRILTYCQPVYNLRTGQFDTAEALMRLKLPQAGLVPPDQFIPIAENHGFIHVLTQIILNKTCREIKRITDEGLSIERVSVNISPKEMRDENFCDDILKIIESNGIPGSKIALEMTESSCEADFVIVNEKIEQLRKKGIQFYLDDFGTGYSNMERIMEIPFDIIKFDRSMLLATEAGERSEKIVKNLAHMFKDMEYSILYEGVEDSVAEERCRNMFASYLQGFKYSRPVPIEQVRNFLPKDVAAQPA